MIGIGFLTLVGLYFLPTIVAAARNKHNTLAIGALNFFLGWSFIGWIIALIWALSGDRMYQPVVHVSQYAWTPYPPPQGFAQGGYPQGGYEQGSYPGYAPPQSVQRSGYPMPQGVPPQQRSQAQVHYPDRYQP